MSSHVVETTCELSALIKAGVMAGSERDAGFCSGADEDDMSGLHSPSASEDSVEVQVTPISLRNKRKLAEPRKIQEPSTAPLKKRRFEQIEESVVTDEVSRPAESPNPFRPWSTSSKSNESKTTTTISSTSPSLSTSSTPVASLAATAKPEQRDDEQQRRLEEEERRRHEATIQEEVLQRLRESDRRPVSPTPSRSSLQRRETRQRFEPPPPAPVPVPLNHTRLQEEPLSLVLRGEDPRVPSHPAVSGTYERSSAYPLEHTTTIPASHHQSTSQSSHPRHHQGGQHRNYKNMTRERRIEANARERTRVHTISAAFDTLRRAIPAYSHNQKLSKLSVLRIACSYIMTLSKIVNTPEGEPTNSSSLGACVDLVSRTIQTEGKLRKRKDD